MKINMKSIVRKFKIVQTEYPFLSTYSIFAKTVRFSRFNRPVIGRRFNELVDKNDYCPKDRNQLVKELTKLAEEGQFSIEFGSTRMKIYKLRKS